MTYSDDQAFRRQVSQYKLNDVERVAVQRRIDDVAGDGAQAHLEAAGVVGVRVDRRVLLVAADLLEPREDGALAVAADYPGRAGDLPREVAEPEIGEGAGGYCCCEGED